jgi:hypothetical protein
VRLRLRHRSRGDGCQRANERGGEESFCFHCVFFLLCFSETAQRHCFRYVTLGFGGLVGLWGTIRPCCLCAFDAPNANKALPLFEIARLLVRLDHVARRIHKRESPHHVNGCRTLVERRHAAPMLIAVA